MGTKSTAAVNIFLSSYAFELSQDVASAIAKFMAPEVVVPAGVGHYKAYDEKNAFQIYTTERALGGTATRIHFSATDPTFDCRPQALEAAVDDAEYDAAGDANASRLDQSRVRTLVTSASIAHENKVVTLAKTVTAEAGKGVWSDSNVDPLAEIDEQIEALATATGMMPNRAVIGLGAWRVLRNHPKVKGRLKLTATQSATMSDVAAMTMNPSLDLRVGVLSKDTTKFGATKNATNIIGSEFFLFIAMENMSEFDPSWLKCFVTNRGSVDSVRSYRDETARSTVHAIDWSEDIEITGSSCGKRITIT